MKKRILKNILIFILLIIAIAGVILPRELNNLDELWNFNFALNIANGNLPYKDFNMVQTPLLPIVCGRLMVLFGAELITMRIFAVLLCSLILFIFYYTLKELNVNDTIISISMILVFLLYKDHFCIDYNFSILLLTMIIILIEIKNKKIKNSTNVIIGILLGLSILLKQTTGLFLCIVAVFYKILLLREKKDWKRFAKEVIYRIIGIAIPVICFIIYLTLNKIWIEFFDYTILGIKTFSNKISYINLLNGNYGYVVSILSILVPALLICMYIKIVIMKHKKEEDRNLVILFAYSIASFIVTFPISDSIHFLIGAMPSIILLIYVIYITAIKGLQKNGTMLFFKYFFQSICTMSICIITILSVMDIYIYITSANKYNKLDRFKYIPAESTNINDIITFISTKEKEGKVVYILDATAAIYMIPANRYNKNYDMFLKGNLGRKGRRRTDRTIEKT